MSKFKISRQGRKLQISDDPRVLLALPKDVSERTWSEIIQKEENELFCFEIREEILEGALAVVYERYMEKQTIFFTVHCSAMAWLKLINWHFYRHDPGEEPSAYPPCYIPKRLESWVPDELPEPCVKDTWSRQELRVVEECPEDPLVITIEENESVEMHALLPIPEKYWFPGKINLITDYIDKDGVKRRHIMDEDPSHNRPNVVLVGENSRWQFVEVQSSTTSESTDKIEVAESEVLQKVTDYVFEEISSQESHHSSLKLPTPIEGSLQGAGDSKVEDDEQKQPEKPRRSRTSRFIKSKQSTDFKRSSVFRSRLPPIMATSLSTVSVISDCHLRNLRMEMQHDIESEVIETPQKTSKSSKNNKK